MHRWNTESAVSASAPSSMHCHLAGGGQSQNCAVKQHVDIRFYANIERMGMVGEDTIHAGPPLDEVHVVLSVCQHAFITHVS